MKIVVQTPSRLPPTADQKERISKELKKKRKAVEIVDDDDDEEGKRAFELVDPDNSKDRVKKEDIVKEEHPSTVSRFRKSGRLGEKLKENGIESLFPVQARTSDMVVDGSDLVGRARTGQDMDATSPNRGKTTVHVEGNLTPKHFRWTYEMECHFLELLLKEDRLGNRVGGAFTSQAYRNILCDIQATFGSWIQKKQLKNKIRSLKHNYGKFRDAFHGTSGFFWNWDTKKFDAENEVWEALIKDNPTAANLRGKRCQHWDMMNTLWSSSRAAGIKSSTVQERCARRDAQFTVQDGSSQSTNYPNSSANHEVSGSESLANATSDQAMHDASGSQPSAGSGKTELVLQSFGKNIADSLDNMSRAIVESAKILSNKVPRSYESSANLFTALQSLELPEDYLLESYEFLSRHDSKARKFLAVTQQHREAMLTRIMGSRYLP